ncbi:TIGR02206 family membrane protein [uncultured Algibacter sp.]|uniref:YwaF family protein n=1 Tax=uncultured Algibacter sp. TaxID=298659 RepID=UPI002638E902|nr:TIGR02206 family membrane protein [uncultured Algibacter sp.]
MSLLIHNAIFLFNRVAIGSLEHLVPIVFSILFATFLISQAKRKWGQKKRRFVWHVLACLISTVVVVFHLNKILFGSYLISTDLPLYLCSLLGLFIPVFTYYREYWMYEILLFWIIGGTLQGVLTPDIPQGFPSFDYFRYWTVHLGLLTIIFYATFVFDYRPKLKSVFKSFFALQVYILIMVFINNVLNANYFYLNEKPKSASLLDYFGEWPVYILVVQIIIIPYFLLIYFPFYLSGNKTE